MSWPADRMRSWYTAAERGHWRELDEDWGELTEPIEKPEAGALIRFDRGDGSFGVGVLPNAGTFITVRHYGCLIAGPVNACGSLKLFRLL